MEKAIVDFYSLPPLGTFKPFARVHHEMDELHVLTVDETTTTKWIDQVHLELCLHGETSRVAGFQIVSLRALRDPKSGEGTESSLQILARAFKADFKNRKRWEKTNVREMLASYFCALTLLVRHPSVRRFAS